ncbi:hypothetical protein [Streptomyces sp. NPDC058683]|uniref:hypothetical protein n=1 Tax=Streptomyces sp. NPDC058683 TaxID=3346597 RepID=UPI00364B3841
MAGAGPRAGGPAERPAVQALGALRNGELSPGELREGALQLAFCIGCGNAADVDRGIQDPIADHEKERARP